MIGKLKGIINSYGEDHVILDVNGVGYLVHCSARTLQALPATGAPVTLAIETHVREDQIRLFGFLLDGEREWFRLLQTVQGVGTKVALSILGTLTPADLASAIALRDKAMVARSPGVGPKVAERIVTELKDKAPAYADLDPGGRASVRRARRAARPAAGVGRGLGPGQSRLRPAAGGRRHRGGGARRRRRSGYQEPDPPRPEGDRQVSAALPARPGPAARIGRLIAVVLVFVVLAPLIGALIWVALLAGIGLPPEWEVDGSGPPLGHRARVSSMRCR